MSPPPKRIDSGRAGHDRAQGHTLEAVVGALLVLTSIAFALQMTIVTPLSASTSSQHIENQQRATADGIMASAAESGALLDTVLYWNDTAGSYHNAPSVGYYTNNPPDTEFGRMLNRSFDEQSIAYNVNLQFVTPSGDLRERRLIHRGEPTENAVSASRSLAVRADDRLIREDGHPSNVTVASSERFFVGKAAGHNTPVYNLVRIEVVVWRI